MKTIFLALFTCIPILAYASGTSSSTGSSSQGSGSSMNNTSSTTGSSSSGMNNTAHTAASTNGGSGGFVSHEAAPTQKAPGLNRSKVTVEQGSLSPSVASRQRMKPVSDLNQVKYEDKADLSPAIKERLYKQSERLNKLSESDRSRYDRLNEAVQKDLDNTTVDKTEWDAYRNNMNRNLDEMERIVNFSS